MKKALVVLLSLALTVSALSACGGKEVAETQQSMTAQVEAVTEQPEQSPAADTREPAPPLETQEVAESEPAVEEQLQEAAQVELFDECDDVVYHPSLGVCGTQYNLV
jgi:type IV secretory pathway VirB10-like protein